MKDKSMVFGEGQQSSNKNTEKCRGMYRKGKNRRIKRNPNVYHGEKRRMHGKKHGTSGSGRRGRSSNPVAPALA